MRHALLHRFQAVLLGAAIGETIGHQYSSAHQHPSDQRSLMPLTRFYAESLIAPNRVEQASDPLFQVSLTTAEAAIALLPVFLFFHEDVRKLRQNVQDVLNLWHNAQISQSNLLAIEHTLAQALLGTLNAPTCIPQLLAISDIHDLPMLSLLQQVQTLLLQPVGLEDAVYAIVSSQPVSSQPVSSQPGTAVSRGERETMVGSSSEACIALALYCFLSTIGDFRLSVLRAAQTGYNIPVVCALTGALSGAYNSTIGIPISWRLSRDDIQQEMLHVSTLLLAQWSGMHDSRLHNSTLVSNPAAMPVVTAPRLLRRSSKDSS
jgi:ADP-ribosylglycohydrolase